MKTTQLLLVFVFLICFSCATEDDNSNDGFDITLVTVGLDDNKLAVNNTARFDAQVSGNEEDIPLSFRWTLIMERSELTDGVNTVTNPYEAGNTIYCVGRTVGDEQIKVEAIDDSGSIRGTTVLDFEILGSDINLEFPRGCFDQPKLIYQQGQGSFFVCNFDGTDQESLGIGNGSTVGISPDGEWLAWNPYQEYNNPPVGFSMYIVSCDGSEIRRLPTDVVDFERFVSDDFPQFSNDSKTLFFRRPNALQEEQLNSPGYYDLVAYDIETNQVNYLTSFYLNDSSVRSFTVSPTTGQIALIKQTYGNLPDGSDTVTYHLSILQPETGVVTDFTELPIGLYNGLDFSPDGEDLIFLYNGASGSGIFRINLTDGSQPLPVYTSMGSDSPAFTACYYYNNGERIVFGDYGNDNNLNLYSVDANGNDLQLITDISGPTFLQGVFE